jgi:hypothetical protein
MGYASKGEYRELDAVRAEDERAADDAFSQG